jgi:xanthine dehydrogenase accessory factor
VREVKIIKKLIAMNEAGEKGVLATIIEAVDSTPGKSGFKMIINENGETFGSIGGGCVEAGVTVIAEQVIKDGQNRIFNFILKGNDISCGGRIKVLVEFIGR